MTACCALEPRLALSLSAQPCSLPTHVTTAMPFSGAGSAAIRVDGGRR
jgi:hypothetical protein